MIQALKAYASAQLVSPSPPRKDLLPEQEGASSPVRGGSDIPEDRVALTSSIKDDNPAYDRTGKIISGKENIEAGTQDDEKQEEAEGENKTGASQLTAQEARQVEKLKTVDAKVRSHEMAHMAAGGGLVKGGASYEFQRGPDGRLYAVAGEVSIDVSEENSPEKTISKMQRVKAAALAPAEPSPQDRHVASAANKKIQSAMMEISKMTRLEIADSTLPDSEPAPEDKAEPSSAYQEAARDPLKNSLDLYL